MKALILIALLSLNAGADELSQFQDSGSYQGYSFETVQEPLDASSLEPIKFQSMPQSDTDWSAQMRAMDAEMLPRRGY